ncbi:MAG: SDR family NAD(P)-dependent oxidoreductase [Nitrospira sp.]|nr:SDR family NAD(P)-dependent oxidoreductase [Nitrospira sp.]
MEGLGRTMKTFIKDKTVLVTGANGFIGSHLSRMLLYEGAEVHVLLRRDSNILRIQDILENITVWCGDLRDYPSICSCMRQARPLVIFHLASLRNVSRDIELLEPVIDINIKGTMNLLQSVLKEKINIECFVNTGTSEEYGDGIAPFSENQREIPVSPYSASKVAITYFCQMLYKTMGLPVVTLRPFLTYGPFQDTDMFVPSLIRHCIEGRNFLMTEGDQTREFNYIDDIVEAYLLTASCPEAIGEVINIGSGVKYKIRDIAQKINIMMGNRIRLHIGALPKRPGETSHFFCNNEKAQKLLGWSPKINLHDGLERTIRWYKENRPLWEKQIPLRHVPVKAKDGSVMWYYSF